MHHTTNANTESTGVLASLRALLPNRRLRLDEALHLAELQANRLLSLRNACEAPISTEIVSDLPGIHVDYDLDMPASGCSDWDGVHRHWVITLRASEPDTRRRFTLLHEFKHVVDHSHPGVTVDERGADLARPAAEIVADYFAACVLMPRRLLKAAYCTGTQNLGALCHMFDVSPMAMEIRLRQVGLTEPTARCNLKPSHTRSHHLAGRRIRTGATA